MARLRGHEIRLTLREDGARALAFAWRGSARDRDAARLLATDAMRAAWSASSHARAGRVLPMPDDLAPDDETPTHDEDPTEVTTWTVGCAMMRRLMPIAATMAGTSAAEAETANALAKAIALQSPAVAGWMRPGDALVLMTQQSGTQSDMVTCDVHISRAGAPIPLRDADREGHAAATDALAALATWLAAKGYRFTTGGRGPMKIVVAAPKSATLAAALQAGMSAQAADDLPRALNLLREIGAGAQAERLLSGGNQHRGSHPSPRATTTSILQGEAR